MDQALIAGRASSYYLLGASASGREAGNSVGRKHTEGAVFETPIEEVTDIGLRLFTLVRVDADTNKLARKLDKFRVREQTVLRCGVAGSEDARDSPALGSRGDK